MVNLAQILTLERPLAILDLETTGLNPERDRITQMGVTIHYPHRDPIAWETLVDPEMPIPGESTKITGITNDMVRGQPTFKMIGPALAPKLTNIDIGGYNVEFDIGFLRVEMRRIGVIWAWDGYVIDAYQIFRRKMPHTLQSAYCEYVDSEGFKGAHAAGNDVAATESVLAGQLEQHRDLPRTVRELSDYCFPNFVPGLDRAGKLAWRGNECILTFGKWNGAALGSVDIGYLQWCIKGNFPEDFKAILKLALSGQYPVKP